MQVGAALEQSGELVAVAMVGRPLARLLQDGWTLEVLRVAVATDPATGRGYQNACSMLYGAAARAAKALGYRRIYSYTLATEEGASLRASGWTEDGTTRGGGWSRQTRLRLDDQPTGPKRRWVRLL